MNLTGSIKRTVLGVAIVGSAVLAGGGLMARPAHAASPCAIVACTPNPQPLPQLESPLSKRLTHCTASGTWQTPLYYDGFEYREDVLTFYPDGTYAATTYLWFGNGWTGTGVTYQLTSDVPSMLRFTLYPNSYEISLDISTGSAHSFIAGYTLLHTPITFTSTTGGSC